MNDKRMALLKQQLADFIEEFYEGRRIIPPQEECPSAALGSFISESRKLPPKAPLNVDAFPALYEKNEEAESRDDSFCDIFKIFHSNDEKKSEAKRPPVDTFIQEAKASETFSEALVRFMQEQDLTDAEVYNRVFMDRKLFNKIRNTRDYQPTKKTALLLAIALRMDFEQAQEFLSRAGFTMTHSSKTDLIVEFSMRNRIYDIFEINEMLAEHKMPLLMKCD